MKTKTISKFIFNKAQYFVSDGNGCEIVLEIDYFHNKFLIKKLSGEVVQDFDKEIKLIAQDLLKRKYRKNFAQKFK